MTTKAQIGANQANAQHSTGPRTADGKAASSQNRRTFGLTGRFTVLEWEDPFEFDQLVVKLRLQYDPKLPFEEELVEKMAQHHWCARRAGLLQDGCFDMDHPLCAQGAEKDLALFLRYQSTHERAFERCAKELRNLKNAREKEKIGFESQKRREADSARKQANEERKQQLHKLAVGLFEARIEHVQTRTNNIPREKTVAAVAGNHPTSSNLLGQEAA